MKRTDTLGQKDQAKGKKRQGRGIRAQLMIYLSVFVVFVILLLWLFQVVLLDDFYRSSKIRQIETAAETLMSLLNSEDEHLSDTAGALAERYDVCILLLDEDQNVLLSAEGTRNCLIHRLSTRGLAWWCAKASTDGTVTTEMFHMQSAVIGPAGSLVDDGFESEIPPEPFATPDTEESAQRDGDATRTHHPTRKKADFAYDADIQSMLYARRLTLPDGTVSTLLLNSQINPIVSTVAALRSQLLAITVIVSLAALLMGFLISRRISTPIIETNEAARDLSHARYTTPPHAQGYREIAELNATLVKAAEDLGQVETLQHELIANISHDLRTPLTMIGGYAEAMRDIPDENTPENMQIIIDETARLSTLVNELLDFSRMQTGSVKFQPAPFCLTEAVNNMIMRVGKLTEKDGYIIRFEHDKRIMVVADEMRIGQVIYNLIGNALTYTGKDKTVTVTQTICGQTARISIHDTGKGIAKDEIHLIWNRYYRTKETHKRAVIGSGLGLNIVRTILEMHAAPYGVESAEGEGTTFWFELPLAAEASPAEPSLL